MYTLNAAKTRAPIQQRQQGLTVYCAGSCSSSNAQPQNRGQTRRPLKPCRLPSARSAAANCLLPANENVCNGVCVRVTWKVWAVILCTAAPRRQSPGVRAELAFRGSTRLLQCYCAVSARHSTDPGAAAATYCKPCGAHRACSRWYCSHYPESRAFTIVTFAPMEEVQGSSRCCSAHRSARASSHSCTCSSSGGTGA